MYSNWAALQVSGSKTKVAGILHKAKATGIYGADPSTQLRAQLKDKIKVRGQYTQFIKSTDPSMCLGIALTMNLDWSHQQKRTTENLTNKPSKLNKSYASPFQTKPHVINTCVYLAVQPSFQALHTTSQSHPAPLTYSTHGIRKFAL
jgi:hypothetical protein